MPPSLSRRVLIAGLTALPAACAPSAPRSYQLSARPGIIRRGGAHSIVIRPIELAPALRHLQIVRSTEGGRVDIMPSAEWSEPLNTMLIRVLVANVGERMPASTVKPDDVNGVTSAQVAVDVDLQRMDLDGSGTLDLAAEIGARVRGRRGVTTRGVALSVRPADDSVKALVEAMNVAVGQLADAITGLLTGAA